MPIAVSVTGCAVAYLVTDVGSIERACAFDMKDSEARRRGGECDETGGGTSLSEGVLLSLKYWEVFVYEVERVGRDGCGAQCG